MPTGENLLRLASYFQVSVDWLLTGKVQHSSPVPDNRKEQLLLEQFRALPATLQAEVLDFVAFLHSRQTNTGEDET